MDSLTTILAATDALWCPFRWYGVSDIDAHAATLERRIGFQVRGVPFVVSGNASQRTEGERELQSLEADRLVVLHRAGKRIGASLTSKGDTIARAMTAGYTAQENYYLLAEIKQRLKSGVSNNGFVLETEILEKSYADCKPADLSDLENGMLPLLVRGWVVSATDTQGRIGYGIGSPARKPASIELPDISDELTAQYDEQYLAGLASRTQWKASTPSQVAVPLSAGLWGAGNAN